MQRILIVLVVGLLSVGCLTPEQKQKAFRDSVVGEYEIKHENGVTLKYVYLDNGIREYYINGKKAVEFKWIISNGELHVVRDSGFIEVWRINADKSITWIANIQDGKRTDGATGNQFTYKKIK